MSSKNNLIITVDDYDPLNIKAANLFLKYNVPAVFFIEYYPHRTGTQKDVLHQVKKLSDLGFEIGSHTMTHPSDLKALPDSILEYELGQSKGKLEEAIGKTVDALCYPRGRNDARVRKAARANGYTQARTVDLGDPAGCNDMAIKPTAHVFNGREEYKGITWAMAAESSHVLYGHSLLMCHSWELERDNLWGELENFIKWTQDEN